MLRAYLIREMKLSRRTQGFRDWDIEFRVQGQRGQVVIERGSVFLLMDPTIKGLCEPQGVGPRAYGVGCT